MPTSPPPPPPPGRAGQAGYHVVMTDTDALWLASPAAFWATSALARASDILVTSDCLAPAAEALLLPNASDASWWRRPTVPISMEQARLAAPGRRGQGAAPGTG